MVRSHGRSSGHADAARCPDACQHAPVRDPKAEQPLGGVAEPTDSAKVSGLERMHAQPSSIAARVVDCTTCLTLTRSLNTGTNDVRCGLAQTKRKPRQPPPARGELRRRTHHAD